MGQRMSRRGWLLSHDPQAMLRCLASKRFREAVSDRRRRLFATACCRRVWDLLTDGRVQRVVEVAERLADGGASEDERAAACGAAAAALGELPRAGTSRLVSAGTAAWSSAGAALNHFFTAEKARAAGGRGRGPQEGGFQAELIRCIFGDPFRPVAFTPEWRTPTAVAIAQGMYESRDFGAMPILADALQEAGCEEEQLLGHCRSPGPHARGCWVVDRVLGRG